MTLCMMLSTEDDSGSASDGVTIHGEERTSDTSTGGEMCNDVFVTIGHSDVMTKR